VVEGDLLEMKGKEKKRERAKEQGYPNELRAAFIDHALNAEDESERYGLKNAKNKDLRYYTSCSGRVIIPR